MCVCVHVCVCGMFICVCACVRGCVECGVWKRGEGGKRRGGIGRMGRSNEVESRRGRGG